MDKTDIRIPTDEELTAYMEESAVSANGAYEQSPVVLMVDDAAIGTLGNFSASIGNVHHFQKISELFCTLIQNRDAIIARRY